MPAVSSPVVEELDIATAGDADVLAIHALETAIEQEAHPGDPVKPDAQALLDLRVWPSYRRERRWVVRDAGRIVASGFVAVEDVLDNQHLAEFDIRVLPEARRRGLGSALVPLLVGAARAWGRTSLYAEVRVGSAGEAFAARLGFERRMLDRRSRLLTAELDRALLEGWVAEAAVRAPDHELVWWEGPCPDELLDAYVDLLAVMNDAPIDDLDIEDEQMTPDRLRAFEAGQLAGGRDFRIVVARHRPSGDLTGVTEVHLNRHWPATAYQGNTCVAPAHRGLGLGRLLKGAMALRLLDEHPALEQVFTWNAASNAHMLDINVAMGFQPYEQWGGWQVETAALTS